ncbi:Pre-mRNA-splicing factor of RES complex-domain-containing protein [Xylariaceae sp. FL1019]|nr:Pre-mRNA-splicing factor of RES complex-domain-containing protein [Xylariaceae sp. FL1019]
MPTDLSKYLAENYLVADTKPSKKRKRKQATSGLIIADDDETGWRAQHQNSDDEDMPMTSVAGTSAEFRKAKKSGWKTLSGGLNTSTPQTQTQPDESSAAADLILASAAAESAAAAGVADGDDAPVMMSDGTYAGLQTGATVSAQLARRRAAEKAEYERATGSQNVERETIYRDATGRRVDVSMKRAELRREADEAAKKKADAELALRGDIQVADLQRRRDALDDAKLLTVARHADDEEINREMKEKVRWGDTMAQFAAPKDAAAGPKGGHRVKGRPVYKGAWAPNRYQIPPGYRWDGVDRGNGFEAERFKAINRRERNKGLEYSWQMDE